MGGTLSATMSPSLKTTAGLSGSGALAASTVSSFACAASFNGDAALGISLKQGYVLSASDSGTGTLTAVARGSYVLAPQFVSTGQLQASVVGTVTFQPYTEENTPRTNEPVPQGASFKGIMLTLIGAGGGGGAGAKGASSTYRPGGAGGGGGAYAPRQWIPKANLGPTYTVSVDTDGSPGGPVTTVNGTGNAGTPGAATTFTSGATNMSAGGGAGGAGGQNANVTIIGAIGGTLTGATGSNGTAGGNGNMAAGTAGVNNGTSNSGGAGGGGAGGTNSINTVAGGGKGGDTNGQAGGTAGPANNNAGNGSNLVVGLAGSGGGGGGGAAGNGGHGFGCGAGGGAGAGSHTGNSGFGGNGGPGYSLIEFLDAIPVLFDALGAGILGSGTAKSFSHNINGSAIVVGISLFDGASPAPTSVTVGGVPMTLLNLRDKYANNGLGNYVSVAMYGLINPPQGVQTIAATGPNGNWAMQSISYRNVASFGTAVGVNGATGAMAVTVPSAPNDMVVNAFGSYTGALTAYSQTQRYLAPYNSGGAGNLAFIMGDALGAASVPFTCTSGSAAFGAIGVPLIGV